MITVRRCGPVRWYRITVQEWQGAVCLRDGSVTRVLGAGRHRLRRREEASLFDLRARTVVVSGQDVPTADGVLLRIGVAVRWALTAARRYLPAAEKPMDELDLAVQLVLRKGILARSHEQVDAERSELAGEIAAGVADRADELGVTVSRVSVRDVVLPGELRRAALTELVARQEGRAALERARAETAAMRSLLNAARLAEQHPALLRLRTLQAATQPGATVVLERER